MSVFTHPAEAAIKAAMTAHAAGRWSEAEMGYRGVLAAHWGDPLATHLLGLVLSKMHRIDEALELLEAAVAKGNPPMAFYLAVVDVAESAGQVDRALAAARKTVEMFPGDPTAAERLARLTGTAKPAAPAGDADRLHAEADGHASRQDWPAALRVRQAALKARHHDPIGHKALGATLLAMDRVDEATAEYQTALRQCPDDAAAYVGLGAAELRRGRILQGIELLKKATELNPRSAAAWSAYGGAASMIGDFDVAVPAARAAADLSSDDPAIHSQLVALLNYAAPDQVLAESKRWAARFAAVGPIDNFATRDRDPDRKLRVGFISPDFRSHSVSYFAPSVIAGLDRERFWVACYAEVPTPDDVTERLKAGVDRWFSTVGVSDEDVAARIHADRVDVLIDLAGHLSGNRLPVMARRPAPVQMTWLGYPNTTGVPTVEYRMTDGWTDLPGVSDGRYTERLLRLPDAFFAYQPSPGTPGVGPLPMVPLGRPTFGLFHAMGKATPTSYDLWAAAMKAVPDARLVWVGLPLSCRPLAVERFTARGVSSDRIEFRDRTQMEGFFAAHHEVDLALDTYPWAGHTTSCHGLWMGVPTLTLPSPTAAGRAGLCLLEHVGLPQLIATDPADFAAKAAAIVGDPVTLEAIRFGLRDRFARSVLTDVARFTRNLEAAIRSAWQQRNKVD